MMRFDRLKWSLILAFLLVALLPLAGLVYLVENQGEALIKDKVTSHLVGLCDKSAEGISRFLRERGNDIRMLAYTISGAGIGSKETLAQHFAMMKAHYEVYLDFFVTDGKGKVRFPGETTRAAEDILLHRKTDIPLAHTGLYASDVFLLEYRGTPVPVLLLSSPIHTATQQRIGTLFALVDFGEVDRALRSSVIAKTGEVYLVNRDGYFLSSSRFGVEILKDRIPPSPQRTDGQTEGIYEPVDYRGKIVLHAFRSIPQFSWYLISEQDKEEALLELYRFRSLMKVYATATFLAVLLLAYGIATLLVQRLKENYRREKELEFQVMRKDKLAALGLLSAGLAHELNTPLANALLYTQMIQEELDEDNKDLLRKRLATVEDVIKRGSSVVRNLLAFTRHPEGEGKATDIGETVDKILSLAGPHCAGRKIRVEKDMEAGMPPVCGEASLVQEILTNLVVNAIDAMPRGGTLTLAARHLPVLRKVRIDVGDTGEGIPPEVAGKVFEPFFTTKKQGEGLGLGLFVSYEMARKLGGTIRVVSAPRRDPGKAATVFTVEFPVVAQGSAAG